MQVLSRKCKREEPHVTTSLDVSQLTGDFVKVDLSGQLFRHYPDHGIVVREVTSWVVEESGEDRDMVLMLSRRELKKVYGRGDALER